jgi:hypothetical protein
MTEGQQTAKRSASLVWLLVALLVALVVVVGGQWWFGRPSLAGQHFIELLSKNQTREAATMLVDASSLRIEAGNVTIKAADGTTATLTEGELPQIALKSPGFENRNGLSDYFASRYRFPVTPSGAAVKRPVEITCIAEGDRIVIAAVK